MTVIKKIAFLVSVLASFQLGFAQNPNNNASNLTSSPYTRYGLGKMGSVGNASTRGMGELGVALRSNLFTNLSNPASLTAIDTLTMLFDVGINADWANFSENGSHSQEWNAGFNYMSFHFPLWKNFAGSMSLTPYSMVGYQYGVENKEAIDNVLVSSDSLIYQQAHEGRGGLQRVMFGVGWRPFHNKQNDLNLGVNLGFIYGTISHIGSLVITSGQGNNTYSTRDMTARAFDLGLGLQYTRRISPTRLVTFGATFSPEQKMKAHADVLKLSNVDTTHFSQKLDLRTPLSAGFGLSFQFDRKILIGAEYSFENWSKVSGISENMTISDGLYKNISKFAAGIDYQPAVYSQNFFKVCHYRAGVNVKTSYLEVYGSQNTEYGVTAGISMPVGVGRRSSLNFSVGYTHLQPSKSDMLSEDYLGMTLGITFNEVMFFRNRLK